MQGMHFTVCKNLIRTLQNKSHVIKNPFRLPKKNLGSFMWVSTALYKVKQSNVASKSSNTSKSRF